MVVAVFSRWVAVVPSDVVIVVVLLVPWVVGDDDEDDGNEAPPNVEIQPGPYGPLVVIRGVPDSCCGVVPPIVVVWPPPVLCCSLPSVPYGVVKMDSPFVSAQ